MPAGKPTLITLPWDTEAMVFGLSTVTMLLVFGIVFFGGLVVGVAGFGYAIVATSTLAAVIEPRTAVVVMIIPLLAANVSLARELDRDGLRSCVRRFWPYVAAAVVGTLTGMALLRAIPTAILTLSLGVFVLGYVVFTQEWMPVPGRGWFEKRCFAETPPAKVGLGFVSGFVFGASNVGVQVVAYLDSLSIDRSVFIGVLAMILVGISTIRVVAAFALGLYGTSGLVVLSAVAAVPGLLGVTTGKQIRPRIPRRYQTGLVLVLLTVIGVRLTLGGAGVL